MNLLERRTAELEAKETLTTADRQSALRMTKLLSDVSADFKNYHFAIVDQIKDEDDAKAEQDRLDDHQLKVMLLIDRLGELVEVPLQAQPITGIKLLRRRIDEVEECYRRLKRKFDEQSDGMDTYALQIQEESVEDLKTELLKIKEELLRMEGVADLADKRVTLERLLLDLKEAIKRLAGSKDKKPSPTVSGVTSVAGVQLPRIMVPNFDGNLLNWQIFWEQFESAIHSKTQLTDSEKLTYLRDALKDGPARHVISGLTQTSANYTEAVKRLRERYDRPRRHFTASA